MGGRRLFVLLLAFAAAMGGLPFGLDPAGINGAVLALKAPFGAAIWTLGFSVALVIVWVAVRETRGKSLEAMG